MEKRTSAAKAGYGRSFTARLNRLRKNSALYQSTASAVLFGGSPGL
jgi:hypothetical protein